MKIFSLIISIVAFSLSVCVNANIPKKLRWASDTESGAPFAMIDPKNPKTIIGFEVEIIKEIAKELNVELEFVQNSWDGLIPGLLTKNYDIAINGIEITPERQKEVLFSRPYYITYEQIVVRKNETSIDSLSDLKGKKVGTLKSSLAQKILETEGGIEILTYEAEVAAYSDLKNGRSDAVFLDAPIAVYYALSDPDLKFVGMPTGQMNYGIAIHKENLALQKAIDLSLKKMEKDGRLREILERWNLWNSLMASYTKDTSPSRTPPVMYQEYLQNTQGKNTLNEKIKLYISFVPVLLKGAFMTMKVSVLAMVLAVVVGMLLALMRLYGTKAVSFSAITIIEVTRGTPLLIQLFFIFYGLPFIGIKFDSFTAAVIGLGFNYGAYEAENYRAGILSVPKTQVEAGKALGMSQWEILRFVVIPQAFRISLPPMTNDFISLLKDSSLVSAITMIELTKVYGQLSTTYYDYFGTGILVAAMYFLLGLPFIRIARYFETRLSRV